MIGERAGAARSTRPPTSPTTSAPWSALILVVTALVLVAATVALGWDRAASVAGAFELQRVVELSAFLAFVLLGSLLVLRRPRHPVGWLLAALGLTVLVQQATQEYAIQSLAAPPSLPAWSFATWAAEWSIAPSLVLLVTVLLLFPTGRPQSRRWGVLTWAVLTGGALLTVGWAISTWPQRGRTLLSGGGTLPGVLELLRIALIVCLPLAVGSLILRFRRASLEERQQLKWLLLAGCGLMAAAAAGLTAAALGVSSQLIDLLGIISIAGVAAAMALAVLRYRLYEIDRILSRTVSYALLTGLLAALYGVGVIAIGALLEPVAPDSSLAVAGSTLLVSGAFNPTRTRLQRSVDRRFNRAQYNAERTVAAFRTRLRDDMRLESLRHELLTAVATTIQPERLSVWLRPSSRGSSAGVQRHAEWHPVSARDRRHGRQGG